MKFITKGEPAFGEVSSKVLLQGRKRTLKYFFRKKKNFKVLLKSHI